MIDLKERVFNLTGIKVPNKNSANFIFRRYNKIEEYQFIPENLIRDILLKPEKEFNRILESLKTKYDNTEEVLSLDKYKEIIPIGKNDLEKISSDTTIEELKDIINKYDLTKIEKLWLMEYIDLLPEKVKKLNYDDIMEYTGHTFTFRGNKNKNVISDIAKINSNVDDYIKVISEHLYYLIDNAEDIYKHYASVYRKDNLPDTVLRLIVINNTHCNYKDNDGKNIHVDGGEWVKVYSHLTEFIMKFLKKKFYK
nr:MAG TPA: hypothetical protein [Caudoviricetes sp.]